jgi:hypothetical protein
MIALSAIAVPMMLETASLAPHVLRQAGSMVMYGMMLMPSLSITTMLLYSCAALLKHRAGDAGWAMSMLAAAVTMAMIPFAWIFMVSTNKALLRIQLAGNDAAKLDVGTVEEAREIVGKWGWLNGCQALFPLVGVIIGTRAIL